VFETFGSHRVMFGSDWPVCLVAASYNSVVELAKEYFSKLSTSEQEAFFRKNAERFYKL
jgi:L-fuconolactonase